MTALAEWENFYVIVVSSAGALIGLQFVVMTLVAENPLARSEALGSTFGTPTVIRVERCRVSSVCKEIVISNAEPLDRQEETAIRWREEFLQLSRSCSSCADRPRP